MQKKLLFVAAAILFLAAGCGKATVQSSTQANIQTNPSPQAMGEQMSMKDIMMSGKSQKCEVDTSTASVKSQGTIYFSNGKMRGDFTSTVNGKTETSHMINDGAEVYTWVDGMAMAVKMAANAFEDNKPTATSQSHQAVDPNAKYEYHCSAWAVDSSMFSPPKNMNFTDMSAMMKSTGSMNMVMPPASAGVKAGGSASACLACNNAGSGKAQCLAALGCK
jgi:hypothetical protein